MQGFCLGFAGLRVGVVARAGALEFLLRPSLAKFLLQPDPSCDLNLEVVVADLPALLPSEVLVASPTGSAVGIDAGGRYLFRGRAAPPPSVVAIVDPALRWGTVYVPPALAARGAPIYPLDTVDLLLAICCLAQNSGVIVHASAVAHGGRGLLFAGSSGVGKSTMASLWSAEPGCVVLGEDTTIVVMREGRPWIYGTPWHENPERCDPLGVPLAGAFLLSHAAENRATAYGQAEGAARLLGCSLLPLYHRGLMQAVLETMDQVSSRVPICHLAFRPDGEAVDYVREVADQWKH